MSTGRYGGRALDWQQALDASPNFWVAHRRRNTAQHGPFKSSAEAQAKADELNKKEGPPNLYYVPEKAQDNAVPMGATIANSGLQGGYLKPQRDAVHGERHSDSANDAMSADDSNEFEALKSKAENRGRLSDHDQVRYDQLNAKNGRVVAESVKRGEDASTDPPGRKAHDASPGSSVSEIKSYIQRLDGEIRRWHQQGKDPGELEEDLKDARAWLKKAETNAAAGRNMTVANSGSAPGRRGYLTDSKRRARDTEPTKPSSNFNRQTGTASFTRRRPEPEPHPMSPEGVKHTGKQFGQRIGGREAKTISALLRGRH